MGLFDFLKKSKTDVELYYEDRAGQGRQDMMTDGMCNFRITVEDVFSVMDRGTVVVGTVKIGSVQVGDILTLQHADGMCQSVKVTGIETFRRMVNTASAGDNVGLLLCDVKQQEIAVGDILIR